MTDRLYVPMARLQQLDADMRSVAAAFSSADAETRGLAGAVGHPGLSHAVGHFTSSWSLQRTELVESLDTLSQQARSVHDAFAQTDDQLAAALD